MSVCDDPVETVASLEIGAGDSVALPLNPQEVPALIRALAQHPDNILSLDARTDLAPAEGLDVADRSIDGRIARLRRKLDTDIIVTVRGRGYVFVPPFGRDE